MTCAGYIFLHKPVKLHGWKREDFQNPFLGLLPAALKPFSQCISYPLWNAALAGEAPGVLWLPWCTCKGHGLSCSGIRTRVHRAERHGRSQPDPQVYISFYNGNQWWYFRYLKIPEKITCLPRFPPPPCYSRPRPSQMLQFRRFTRLDDKSLGAAYLSAFHATVTVRCYTCNSRR